MESSQARAVLGVRRFIDVLAGLDALFMRGFLRGREPSRSLALSSPPPMSNLFLIAQVTASERAFSPAVQLSLYCLIVGLASFFGGAIAASFKLGHRRLQMALSFVAGTMLGVGLLHLLPHAVILAIESSAATSSNSHGALHASLDGVMLAVVVGFVAMFLLERFFHFHQHESPEEAGHHDCCDDGCSTHEHASEHASEHTSEHTHAHQHKHDKHVHTTSAPRGVTQLGWIGAAIGLTLHSVLEGVALAAAVLAAASDEHAAAVGGVSTFVVILLHKPFDGLTVATLVRAAGRPAGFAHAVNAVFALVVPVGAALLWFGVSSGGGELLPYALAFSAGTFLCIATSDLLPELQFHRHDRVALSLSLLLGLAVAGTIARIESSLAQSQSHEHEHAPSVEHDDDHDHDHEHDAHDHADPAHAH